MSNSRVDRILQALLAVSVAGFVFLLYSTIHEQVVNVGDTAPNFTITANNGRPISPTNFGGKLLLLNFWATWCPPCVNEVPSLDQLQRKFRDKGLVVLGVSVDKEESAYKEFVNRFNIAYLTARDPDQNINHNYGTVQFPETYVINAQGKVVGKIISETNWMGDKMINYVQSLL